VPQVIFPGGDGWLYSFDPAGNADGSSKLLWKFDCNLKDAVWQIGQAGERSNLITAVTIANDLVYMTVGDDPEHGEGPGRVLCIDPTKRGDVSPELVFNTVSPNSPIPHKRVQACDQEAGDFTCPNPNSALVWKYTGTDLDRDGNLSFEESMHCSMSWIVIEKDLLFVTDFAGLVHCLDPASGHAHWTYDLVAHCWSTPVISANHVFVTDEDGDVDVLAISHDPTVAFPGGKPIASSNTGASAFATPMIHNNVLYVLSNDMVYAIADPKLKLHFR
jgi:outer membrane protein assembly factor BamB